jgi:hypothetical protein
MPGQDRKIAIFILIFTSAITVLFFQNCAKEFDPNLYKDDATSNNSEEPNDNPVKINSVNPANLIRNAVAGSNTSLSISATGDGLVYQWQKNGLVAAGQYIGLVRDNKNREDYRTFSLNVSPTQSPTPTTNPPKNLSVSPTTMTVHCYAFGGGLAGCEYTSNLTSEPAAVNPQTLALTASAEGPSLTYQWYKNNVAIAGATSSSFLIFNNTATVGPSLGVNTYKVTVRNSDGELSGATSLNYSVENIQINF